MPVQGPPDTVWNPSVDEMLTYLGQNNLTGYSEQQVSDAIYAECQAQVRVCRIPEGDTFPADLFQARLRRVARNLAMRNLPLGVQVDAEGGGMRIGSNDPEVRRLEAPWRKLTVGWSIEVRQALADAASTVPDITGVPFLTTATSPGVAWPRLNRIEYPDRFPLYFWDLVLVLPQDLATAERYLEDHIPGLVDAVHSVMAIDRVTPQQLQITGVGTLPVVFVSGHREE